jgi:hypothetical protein
MLAFTSKYLRVVMHDLFLSFSLFLPPDGQF